MPSDKRNSIIAKAMGLISLLFDIHSSLNVPFGSLQYVQYLFMDLPKPSFASHSS